MLHGLLRNKWISTAWGRENAKEENSIVEEAMKTMEDVGAEIRFEGDNIWIDGELIDGEWKPPWKRLKVKLVKARHAHNKTTLGQREQRS